MKLYHILVPIFLLGIFSCSKSNDGKPAITIKSISPTVVSRGDIFVINMGFTEENGSVIDSLFIVMHRLNLNQQGTVNEYLTLPYAVPSYPSLSKGDFQLSFARTSPPPANYGYLPDPNTAQNDTVHFSFYVKDSKNKTSDTVSASSNIIILAD